MRALLLCGLLLTAGLAGCLGGDDAGGPGEEGTAGSGAAAEARPAATLPHGLTMDDAEELSYDETTVAWKWTGTVTGERFTPETEALINETATTAFDVPTGIWFELTAVVTFGIGALGLHIEDADGTTRCLDRPGYPALGRCNIHAEPTSPTSEPARWTVRVEPHSSYQQDFELTLRITATSERIVELPRSEPIPDPEPGCDGDRSSFVHSASGDLVDEASLPVLAACAYRTGVMTRMPTVGVLSDGTLVMHPAIIEEGDQGRSRLARSTDGGLNWETKAFPEPEPGPGRPFGHVDQTTDRIFADVYNGVPEYSLVSYSDDGGESWEQSQVPPTTTANAHQSLVAGPPVTSDTERYPNIVYRCARWLPVATPSADHWGLGCHRSLDGGATWQSTTGYVIPSLQEDKRCDVMMGDVHADQRGWLLYPFAHCGTTYLAVSQDEGESWTLHTIADPVMGIAEGTLRGPSIAIDREGTWYYAWVAGDGVPRLATSQDDGDKWSHPIEIQTPGVGEVRVLQTEVGAPGAVAFAFYGTRAAQEDSEDELVWDGFLSVTMDATNEDPVFRTVRINEPDRPLLHGDCGSGINGIDCQEAEDLIGLVIGPDGAPYASFVDGCSAAWTTCEPDDGDLGRAEAIVAKLWGVDLWDEVDPNGPYPDEAASDSERSGVVGGLLDGGVS